MIIVATVASIRKGLGSDEESAMFQKKKKESFDVVRTDCNGERKKKWSTGENWKISEYK